MKNTWKLLNGVMNRKMKEMNSVSNFHYNDKEIYDKQEIAYGFNDFFVNIGPDWQIILLVQKIMMCFNI